MRPVTVVVDADAALFIPIPPVLVGPPLFVIAPWIPGVGVRVALLLAILAAVAVDEVEEGANVGAMAAFADAARARFAPATVE